MGSATETTWKLPSNWCWCLHSPSVNTGHCELEASNLRVSSLCYRQMCGRASLMAVSAQVYKWRSVMCDYVTWTFVCNRRITLIRGVLTTLFLTFGRLSFEWLSLFGTPSYSFTLLHKYYGHWILSKMHLSPLLSDSTRVRCDVFI